MEVSMPPLKSRPQAFNRSLLGLLVPLGLLAQPALADVRNLTAAGVTHPTLQGALDAANDGDTLLVGPGTYDGFTLDGKGLNLLGAPHGEVIVSGAVHIQNLPSSSQIQIRGVQFQGRKYEDMTPSWPQVHETAIEATNNTGALRFFDCEIRGGSGLNYQLGDAPVEYDQYNFPDGGPALVAVNCLDLALLDSRILGGAASGSYSNWDVTGGVGAHGLLSTNSAIALYDSVLVGGEGGHGGVVGSDAGDAAHLSGLGLFASGCTFRGGDGGDVDPTFQAGVGDGGAGLWVALGTNARLIDNSFQGGAGGCCSQFGGAPGPDTYSPSGPLIDSPGSALSLRAPRALAADGESFHLQVEGVPGQRVFLVVGAPHFQFVTGPLGVKLVPFPTHFDFGRNATIGASGVVDWFLPAWELPDGTNRTRTAQAFVRQGTQITAIGGAVLLTAIDDESGPDCNGNGTHDVIDVTSGASQDCNSDFRPDECAPQVDCNGNGLDDVLEIQCMGSTDANGNMVPDTCENFANWYVDVNASGGGNGSAGAPFQTIGAAFAAAQDGHSISVAAGTYVGAGNRNLLFNERELTVFSPAGSANCIIDLQGLGMAFDLTQPEGRATLRGLTIKNADQAIAAVRLLGGESTLEDCVFRLNAVTAVQSSGVLNLTDCEFQSNTASFSGGAISSFGRILAKTCNFGGNTAGARGGAISLYSAPGGSRMDRCVFRNNNAASGAAITLEQGELVVDNCAFLANSSLQGGAINVLENFAGGTKLVLTSSTLSKNSATGAGEKGAAIYSTHQPEIVIQNSILWGNASSAGTNIHHAGNPSNPSGTIHVTHCDVEFGLASIAVHNGTLTTEMLLAADPLFANPAMGDYRLGAGSPCADAGSNPLLLPDALDVDFDFDYLELAPLDLLGAARRVDDPNALDTGTGNAPLTDMGAFERP